MRHLALSASRQRVAVFIADAPVKVPFHIGDGRVFQHVGDPFDQVVLHILSGKIQDQLIAAERRAAPGRGHRPFRMGAVQIAVYGDALRLKPDTETQSQSRDALSQLLQAASELFFIGIPVSQAGIIAVPLPEPAVVHDEKLDPQLRRVLRDVHQLVPGKVKIGPFPVVDQNGPAPVLPLSAADMIPDQTMEDPADASLSVPAVGHQHLGRRKGLAGLKLPGKIIRMDAADQPGLIHLILLRLHQEFSAVDKGKAVAVSPFLIRIPAAHHHKGIVVMAGRAAHASHGLDAVDDAAPLQVPFHGVSSVKGQPVIISPLPVQAEARRLQKRDLLFSSVRDGGRSRDHIQLLKNAVEKPHRHAAFLILQIHRERFRLLRRSVSRRQAGQ